MSADRLILGKRVRNLDNSPAFKPISKVRITAGEDANGDPIVFEAGTDAGRVVEADNPLITDQRTGNAVADNVLRAIQGYAYQPYEAAGALLDPAAELGDAVSFDDLYSVLADVETRFTPLMTADIAARANGDLEHEYPYELPETRAQKRTMAAVVELEGGYAEQQRQISEVFQEIGSVDAEGSILNRLTTIEADVSGVHVYTESEIQDIVGRTTIQWANVSITPEEITSSMGEYFDSKGAASDALDAANLHTNTQIGLVESAYRTEIAQTAKDITATVAAQEVKWDIPDDISGNIVEYGYLQSNQKPDDASAQGQRNKFYLDQTGGRVWKSDGSRWIFDRVLTLITTNQSTVIQQNSNSITLLAESVYELGNEVASIQITPNNIALSVAPTILRNAAGQPVDVYGNPVYYESQYVYTGGTDFTLTGTGIEARTTTVDLKVKAVNVEGILIADGIVANAAIQAPRIYSDDMTEYLTLGRIGSFNGLLMRNNRGDATIGIYDGDFGWVGFYAKKYEYMRINSENSTQVVYAYGTWDFRNATILLPN